jgi:hypothetical protein
MTSLRQRMSEDMQVRNLALNTQASYLRQVSLFARYFNKSPEALGPEDIRTYQVYLTNEKDLSTSSILVAVSALRFLYNVSLKKNWNLDDVIPTAKNCPNARECGLLIPGFALLGRSVPAVQSPAGTSQSNHGDGAEAGRHLLQDDEVRAGICGSRSRVLRREIPPARIPSAHKNGK